MRAVTRIRKKSFGFFQTHFSHVKIHIVKYQMVEEELLVMLSFGNVRGLREVVNKNKNKSIQKSLDLGSPPPLLDKIHTFIHFILLMASLKKFSVNKEHNSYFTS